MTASKLLSINTPESWKAGDPLELTLYGVKATFRYCPPGTFLMGRPEDDEDDEDAEDGCEVGVQHEVTLTRGFWLLETPVTQALWMAVTGKNPSLFRGAYARPIENVSWYECNEFVRKLNNAKVAPDVLFDFPTEAEWEYACRAGTTSRYNCGDELTENNANFNRIIGSSTPVKSYAPNAWGFYDMHGNVWEWCSDWYGDYPRKPTRDPQGPKEGVTRVVRGGCWYYFAFLCRSDSRNNYISFSRFGCGFRLALRSLS